MHSTGANNPNLGRYIDASVAVPAVISANAYGNHWNTLNATTGVHAFVGYDVNKNMRVAQMLPYDRRAWGVGTGGSKGNWNTSRIQFEICEDGLTDETYFNKAFNTAIDYCVYLCQEFSIPVANIQSHHEGHLAEYASNHADCDHWLIKHGKNMDWFRSEVQARLDNGVPAEEPSEETGEEKMRYIIHAGVYSLLNKGKANETLAILKAAGYTSAYLSKVNGCYVIRVSLNENRDYALRNAEQLEKAGLEYSGIIAVK